MSTCESAAEFEFSSRRKKSRELDNLSGAVNLEKFLFLSATLGGH